MEQEPGPRPRKRRPDRPASRSPGSSHPGDAGCSRRSGASSSVAPSDAGSDPSAECRIRPATDADGDGDDGESVFGPWEALEGTLGAAREREELLAGFAPGGVWDKHPPGPELAAAVARATSRTGGAALATGRVLIGLLRAMALAPVVGGRGPAGGYPRADPRRRPGVPGQVPARGPAR